MSSDESVQSKIGPEATYFESLNRGEWKIQSCGQCGKNIFYPRSHCPQCGNQELTWFAPSGKGTVYSKTTIARASEQGGGYNVSLIDLDEGVRIMSRVEGVAPEAISIGERVAARVDLVGESARIVFEVLEEPQ